jgi:DnaK suppressor protein
VPDILANAGGVVVRYLELAQDLRRFFWDERQVNCLLAKDGEMIARDGETSQIRKLKEEREQAYRMWMNLREMLESEIESDADEGDPGLAEREMVRTLMRSLKSKLASIDYALWQAQKGLYGICEGCGKPIDPARLEAMPEATLCLECKALAERQSGI